MEERVKVNIETIQRAMTLTKEMNQFKANVEIIAEDYQCNAKSVLAIFAANLLKPVEVVIHTDDENELNRFREVMDRFNNGGEIHDSSFAWWNRLWKDKD